MSNSIDEMLKSIDEQEATLDSLFQQKRLPDRKYLVHMAALMGFREHLLRLRQWQETPKGQYALDAVGQGSTREFLRAMLLVRSWRFRVKWWLRTQWHRLRRVLHILFYIFS